MLTTEVKAPYRHLKFVSMVSRDTEEELLKRLEDASWIGRTDSFYRFDVIEDDDVSRSVLELVVEDSGLRDKRRELEDVFGCRLSEEFRLELHRYGNGAGIGAHTDSLTSEVRCVLSLNRGWDSSEGGVWVLASDSALQVGTAYLPSLSNTGFIFATAANSFHALSIYHKTAIFGLTIRIPRVQV